MGSIDRTLQLRVRVYLELIEIDEYSTLSRAPELESHHWMQFYFRSKRLPFLAGTL